MIGVREPKGRPDRDALLARVQAEVAELPRPTFDYVIVDEAQDVSVAELRLLAALGGGCRCSERQGSSADGSRLQEIATF